MTGLGIPPPIWAGAALGVQLLLTNRRPTPASATLGALTAAASGVLAVAALREFGRRGTTADPLDFAHVDALVTSGPNRITRNPMYVGLTGILLSNALAHRSVRALAPVVVFVVVIDRLQIRPEEAMLKDRFGPDFVDYASRVPRWVRLPWPRRAQRTG